MDRRFLATTAIASALTFGGVLFLTAPPATNSPCVATPLSSPALFPGPPPTAYRPGVATTPSLPFAGPSPAAPPIASPIASNVYYAGCNEVRAAGAAPLYRGQPGYRPEMDGDDDGIACEPHRNE